jgi:hypothetical protein
VERLARDRRNGDLASKEIVVTPTSSDFSSPTDR